MIQGNFEAEKHSFKQGKNGMIVGLMAHPNELPVGFVAAAMNTRFKITYEEILDEGEFVHVHDMISSDIPSVPIPPTGEGGGGERYPRSVAVSSDNAATTADFNDGFSPDWRV